MGRGKGRDRSLETQWRRLLMEQSRSGWSIRQFCAMRGLRESSFYFWRRELQKRRRERSQVRNGRPGDSGSTPPPTNEFFLPVVVSPTALAFAEPVPIEIVLADAVVRVPAQFDAASLTRVIEVLRGAAAEAAATLAPREARSC